MGHHRSSLQLSNLFETFSGHHDWPQKQFSWKHCWNWNNTTILFLSELQFHQRTFLWNEETSSNFERCRSCWDV